MVKNFTDKKLKLVVFFLITLLFKPLWLVNNNTLGIPGDDMSYWLHSATIAFDQDINYLDDYDIDSSIFNSETNTPSHPPGAGYLSSPFVFLLSLLDRLIENSQDITRTNPTKSFAYLGYFAAGLFYTYFGSLLLSKIIKKFNNKYAGLLLFCGLISTLIHFVSTRFLMAHATEFFLCSAIIYILEKKETKELSNSANSLLLLIYFLLAITRPSTFLYSLTLIFIYRKKFRLTINSALTFFIQLLFLSTFYIYLSRKLYQNNFMFLNTYGSNMDEYTSSINLDQLLSGLLNLPNLFFSTNMGIVFSTPIVFLAIIVFLTKLFRKSEVPLNIFLIGLFFSTAFLPLLIWQGREVAYGQRLLIGLLPFCILITCKYLKNNQLVLFTKFLTIGTYIGYLFFYSSQKLTLKPGTTLWGTKVGFTAENYYIEVLKAFTNIETILSALLRNIYAVDFLKLINLRNFLQNSSFINSSKFDQLNNFLLFADVYNKLDIYYLLLINIFIFGFSFVYTKLIFNMKN